MLPLVVVMVLLLRCNASLGHFDLPPAKFRHDKLSWHGLSE